jgi:xanthine dehydrogenase YagT iron-sulfur-binding subunit
MGKKYSREKDSRNTGGMSRRGFISSVGAGAVAATAVAKAGTAPAEQEIKSAGEMMEVSLRINGRRRKVLVEPRWTLLYVLRDTLGLTATKVGCERGECGACTVLIDDRPRYACMTLAVEAEGHEITTLEGLMEGEELGPVQQAFLEEDAFQCGFCTPGQIMSVEGLLRANPEPNIDEIRVGVSGNLCRCGAYQHIFKAAEKAGEYKRGKGGKK